VRGEGRSPGKAEAVRRACRVCTTLGPGEIESQGRREGIMNSWSNCSARSKRIAWRRSARYGDCTGLGVCWTRRKGCSEQGRARKSKTV
jgi:hypothetical protein